MEKNNIYKNLNKKWVQWFVGFCDAEANFQVYPKKRVLKSGIISKYNVGLAFHLSLHNRDIDILKDIKNKLDNIGVIYEYKNKPDARLAVNDKLGLLYLINIFDLYPLFTKNQLMRYRFLRKLLVNDVKEFKTIEEYNYYKTEYLLSFQESEIELKNKKYKLLLSYNNDNKDNWIIGFINGEGCFYMNKNKCNFFIEHTDKQALEIIKHRLSFGPNVLERSPRSRDIGKEIKTTYILIISSKKDIENLIVFLDNKENAKLQGNKYIQYIEWKEKWN